MSKRRMVTLDGNEAAGSVAHRLSEVIAIYPITPSSPMGEFSDEWSSAGKKNVWGQVPQVTEMQSEAGAAGTVHGSLLAGALTTTFTASQGLLLMIPNMYKIAGELMPFCMHVTARTLASHALSIFGDHGDVMACRQTGFAMLCSGSVQEAHDMALIAHAATLDAQVPFLHFFDGFRTSHEVAKIELLDDSDLLAMVDEAHISRFRSRALTPDHPRIRGTAQNPDVFFQAREACNPFYDKCHLAVEKAMTRFAALTGRAYHLFDYVGHPEAERVIILMGSGAETAHETVEHLVAKGEKIGILKVRLFRPFRADAMLAALPKTVKSIAVLDRSKEPGALGEPLYLDIVTAIAEAEAAGTLKGPKPRIISGRYGLSSKEFTPAMVKAIFDELAVAKPRLRFTVGINDDVTHLSLPYDEHFDIEPADVVRAMFYGLGADGTVGANKNSIKIIGEDTPNYAQGYFVYDSKKSGAITISHLRFGPRPIRSAYLVSKANFVACHQYGFLDKYDVLGCAAPGAVFLLNSPFPTEEAFGRLNVETQKRIIEKKLRFFVIDAYKVGKATGMGVRINTIMQTCFFAISGVLPREEAIEYIKAAIKKTYGKRGEEVVKRNFAAVDHTLENLHEVKLPAAASATRRMPAVVSTLAPEYVKNVTSVMMSNRGDTLPVSVFEADGSWATGTTQWEKRNIADEIPIWDDSVCIQCNKCAFVCPHAAIRAGVYEPSLLEKAPEGFRSCDYKAPDFKGMKFTIQVAPEDCTACRLCVMVCPAKNKSDPKRKAINMTEQRPILDRERANYDFFLTLPEPDRSKVRIDVKGSQFLTPLFEYSGACAGCGETPYIKLLSQLFGDRLVIANATGCSSIYGGNLPTTPYTTNRDGRGPAWANSLFEDNAEFGLGMRLALNKHADQARDLLKGVSGRIGDVLVKEILEADQLSDPGIQAQRARVKQLRSKLVGVEGWQAARLDTLADYLVRKTVWIIGGDGWAYDIGYGGLDHVLSQNADINILVLDTEVYSNTGGQASKSTPMGASAKFAAAGKLGSKKDLGLMAMAYQSVYVAKIAFGAKDAQTVKAMAEADSYGGPSILLAYSHCIAHGYDMASGLDQQKAAVECGHWPLYRYDPRLAAKGASPLQLDSAAPKGRLDAYTLNETRYRVVQNMNPALFAQLMTEADRQNKARYTVYESMAKTAVAKEGQ